ncbi:hypothetical protein ACH3O9_00915 [Leeuwenhoekiella sp. A16]|uniref:hypothetical protein n=1 Tax=Leeuwenhoekiella sp. A16 TaxID=3141462 RepID=UPI003A806490
MKTLKGAIIIFLVLLVSCKKDTQENKGETLEKLNSKSSVTDINLDTIPCMGALGDVKYSILPLKNFQYENGNCWILMDSIDRREAQRFRLFQRYKIDTIPDARGVFLRGMNEGRNSNTGDVWGNREIGNYQIDTFQVHKHNIDNIETIIWAHTTHGNQAKNMVIGSFGQQKETYNSPGGRETRPRNICLYTYIKVN